MGPMWQTPEQLRALVCELVGWESVSGGAGEARFGDQLAARLRQVPGLVIEQGDVGGGRSFVTALHQHRGVVETIVLMSHFDTVDTAEYGTLEPLAFDPVALTEALHAHVHDLPADARADLESGEWLFGRGVMDMKSGLALHMAIVERAAAEQWPINLLLLSTPDEEVNSDGMRAAVPRLVELQRDHDLQIVLFLNGEPSFPARPGDEHQYLYSGSIGKLMPSVLCWGRETHAGTPLAGMTSSWIASYVTRAVEWNEELRETVHGEPAPLPVTLDQRDLRDGYSTQTPFRTRVLYNVFVMERTAAQVLERFEQVVRGAAGECMDDYRALCARERIEPLGELRVLRFEELVVHATSTHGVERVDAICAAAEQAAGDDLRDRSFTIADALLAACPGLTPAIVVLYAPPYYPPVSSAGDRLVEGAIARVRAAAGTLAGRPLARSHWFNGISDLSYVSWRGDAAGWEAYERNTPGYASSYDIPFEAMASLEAPVLNVGPFGTDPHQRTERVHERSAFQELPHLLADLVLHVADATSRR